MARLISTNFCGCCLWPWIGLLHQGDDIPRGRSNFGGFFPIDNALYSTAFENNWIDRNAVWDDEWALPEKQCVTWGWWSPKGKRQFWGKHVPDKPYTPNNFELDWSMQRHIRGADAWLWVLYESIIGREVGVGLHIVGKVWCLQLLCYCCHYSCFSVICMHRSM